jgi:uncharacterized protein (TIGR00725 family)
MSKIIIGVMGPGDANPDAIAVAFELGQLIAIEGWVLLTGGRDSGIMDAACKGAKEAGGLTVGILPGPDGEGMSDAVDIPIFTGMGQARNNINVLSSKVVIACGMGPGTASEVALALKAGKKVVLLGSSDEAVKFFQSLGKDDVFVASQPDEAIAIIKTII